MSATPWALRIPPISHASSSNALALPHQERQPIESPSVNKRTYRWATSPGGNYLVRTAHRWRCRRYRRVGITPLPRVPYRAVCPHRDLTRTARFVADASGLTTLDLMHAPQSSPAFSLRSEVSMLTAPRHTRPLRPSCHGGTGFTGTSPCPGQTSLRSVAQGEACGRVIDPVVRPSAIGHQVGHRPFPATLVGTPPALTAWCNCTNGEVHLRIAPLVIARKKHSVSQRSAFM